MPNIFWFRRDLRLADHPALNTALASSDQVYLVATADVLGSKFSDLKDIRKNSLRASWRELSKSLDGRLTIVESPKELLQLAKNLKVESVFASRVFDTLGVRELDAIAKDLAASGINLLTSGGNYAVDPGTVRKGDGTPYRVYTPFYNEWFKIDPGSPVVRGSLKSVRDSLPLEWDPQIEMGFEIRAGEEYALTTLRRFVKNRSKDYSELRNRPDVGGTSHLSHALSHGEIHPRTILAVTPEGNGGEVFRKEIAWREFYADVLWKNPQSLTEYLDPKYSKMQYNFDADTFDQWCRGETGYPMVDAGLRQLATTGWMHNRVRMIVASFLVKDLHVEWQYGAKWFEEHLTDFDPASNSHGWQWTAGCGTDASPYYRVFNPVMQGLKFDPNGEYVRKFIPELRHLDGASAHEPWNSPDGYSQGYASRMVDHAEERIESLARLEALKGS
jgi:deoxyribodipyrimidine photo-lyase